jgi:hypothetical protein
MKKKLLVPLISAFMFNGCDGGNPLGCGNEFRLNQGEHLNRMSWIDPEGTGELSVTPIQAMMNRIRAQSCIPANNRNRMVDQFRDDYNHGRIHYAARDNWWCEHVEPLLEDYGDIEMTYVGSGDNEGMEDNEEECKEPDEENPL